MIRKFISRIVLGLATFALIFASFAPQASAAQITARSVLIGNSQFSAVTTYAFTFTAPTSTTIKSIDFQACTTASGACTTPSGFSVTGSSIGSAPTGLGSGGSWTANTSTPGSLRVLNASNTGSPSAGAQVFFNAVTNPSATNATYFFRITTYSDAAWTTPIGDTGTVATSTAGQITVTATVDETLTFTLTAATAALGTLSPSSTKSTTSSMAAGTNAATGYNITVAGSPIAGLGTDSSPATSVSTIGTSKFGINLVSNASPATVGANPSGGTGTFGTGYGTADSYKYIAGSTVATATGASALTTFTVTYIANISTATPPGNYSTTLTYVATANF